jgi:(2Fe-2S) ferredoxin
MERWKAQYIVRLVMCMGRHCNADNRAQALYERLVQELGEPATFRCRDNVRWEIASCLSHCEQGPNFVFYPDGEWFHEVTPEMLDEILAIYRNHQAILDE